MSMFDGALRFGPFLSALTFSGDTTSISVRTLPHELRTTMYIYVPVYKIS